MEENLAKSFTCECGKEHVFDSYVYAHWDILLIHTCSCGRQHEILRGRVTFYVSDDDE